VRLRLLPLLLLLAVTALAGDTPKQVTDSPEGKRAFDDLTAYYADNKKEPPYKQAIADLGSPDEAKRKAAGAYLTALFKQLFADESNGRAPFKRTPFFGGGGSTSDAREFRKTLAQAFGKDAQGDAALDTALWLVDSEKDARNQAAGVDALRRIKGGRSTEIFKKLLQQPHPNAAVVKSVIEEVAARGLQELEPDITRLCEHYRASVREAAKGAAAKIGSGKIPGYKPEAAFTPWLDQELKNIAAMVPVEIPKDAKWMRFTLAGRGEGGKSIEFSGWLLSEKDGKYQVLDYFGMERSLNKEGEGAAKAAPRTFEEEAKALLEVRASGDASALSRHGGLTAQFEPRFVSVPEALVAAWSYTHGDKASAAAILFPRIADTADDRWVGWVARDLIGHAYFQRMLDAFTHERDYPGAIALGKHLSKPIFDEYNYQERARNLTAQLEKRSDDFKTFVLPMPEKWAEQKAKLSRAEQINFLADHLRLLNAIQMGQPGDVNYADEQHAEPFARAKAATKVINPYNELLSMKLDIADIPTLAPHLADENFMLAYSYWRDFHTKRTLHQVNWAIAAVINDTAKKDLSEVGLYMSLDDAGKKKHIEKILDWCKANAGKTRDQLPDERAKPTGGPHIDAP
jgi:hypothetical protein